MSFNKPTISSLLTHSHYLARLAEDFSLPTDTATRLQAIIAQVNALTANIASDEPVSNASPAPSSAPTSTAEVAAFLVSCKREFALLIAVLQLEAVVEYTEMGRLQSAFADATINLALHSAWQSNETQKLVSKLPAAPTGLFVLGLGKLGGLDLNYSSDVDIVAFFDETTLPVSQSMGQGYIVNKILQQMSALLQPKNSIDFVWRVDWRLRANSSSSLLAMNTAAAESYYFFKSMPWHRLALMKARVIAGDITAGETFYTRLQPYIWRQNLDYRAVDELAYLKTRINLEHPALRHQRQQVQPLVADCSGFNVKLGSGGIREIEFIVNALQLLWGGRRYDLRTSNTLEAINILVSSQYLKANQATQLCDAYQFLRKLENVVQMLANAHQHSIPTNTDDQLRLLSLMVNEFEQVVTWQQFCESVLEHRRNVNRQFTALFNEQGSAKSITDTFVAPNKWLDTLNERSKVIITIWNEGFTEYGVSNNLAVETSVLANTLLEKVYHTSQLPDNALAHIDDFLLNLSNPEQFIRLLVASTSVLERWLPILLHSPHTRILLKQSPHIVDALIDTSRHINYLDSPKAIKLAAEFICKTTDYGVRLERLRRYVNEHLFQCYVALFNGEMNIKKFQASLTLLAEETLETSLRIVADELKLGALPLTVLGLGKLGMNKMAPLSDLDLVFVFADNFPIAKAQRVVSRLQTTLSTPLKEGIAYELDTRLRPSGNSGPPTVFVSSFAKYHHERAKNWEHIALLPARIVAGDKQLGQQVLTIKRGLLSTPREPTQWFNDANKMWLKIVEHRIQDTQNDANIKLRAGGLMQSEYLGTCLSIDALNQKKLTISHINNSLSRSSNPNNDNHFIEVVSNAEIIMWQSNTLAPAIEFWSALQIWERLLGIKNSDFSAVPNSCLTAFLSEFEVNSIEALQQKIDTTSATIKQATQRYFAKQSLSSTEIKQWEMRPVIWLTKS